MGFVETSAKEGNNIEFAFTKIVEGKVFNFKIILFKKYFVILENKQRIICLFLK